ncbi:ethanolamine utilization microcompartment protein EutS [Aminithiophilus ramosus]|uniref:Ethanolamine utilization microcompartment protein EutS n=2 Tax=Synergistales TaxID=649776 RepID=A0A9Q7EWY9_9BACT|nr:ethanolamine utilization microcompartment protein EutS [Aminithiophilus ramosus]QTX32035.1 ethanolamine utilization microcompartment protein EutS [Aminithiophilus ramosus]QVL35877.1 ethanolamine utilization microcompartment protein EutS [Synergistota bacterium]
MTEEKRRVVQEYVPGKQVTLAHVICNPRRDLCERVGVDNPGAIGVMTITPGEGAVIAADIASKAASVHMEFVDRFTGCLMITGDISSVERALQSTVAALKATLGFYPAEITRS